MSNKDTQPLSIEQKAKDHAEAVLSLDPGDSVTYSKRVLRSRIEEAYILGANTRHYQPLIDALREIENPIAFMRSRLQDGEQLNGQYAIQLSNDANYLKGIAIKALESHRQSINKEVGEDIVEKLRKAYPYGEDTVYVWNECCDKLKELLTSK